MGKFKVGDKVRFIGDYKKHISEDLLKEIYNKNEILEISYITHSGCYEVKEYPAWTFEEDELELIKDNLKIGDTVQPKPYCIGYPDYFRIVGIKGDCNISYDLEQLTFNGRALRRTELLNWEKLDFNVVPSIKYPMDIVTQQVLADIKLPKYEPYISGLTSQIMGIEDHNNIYNVEGEKYMKILGIYSRKANSIIEKKYDELEKEVRDNDTINKIIQDASNQINVLLDRDEKNAISLVPSGLYCELLEPKSSEKIVELKCEREREERNVEKLIEEVKARLEICDDNETSKVAVLKEYGILDKDGKIAEYKIEKKGKK